MSPSSWDKIERILPWEPRVTVVIACYNHGRYLAEALDSLEAQTFPYFEVIVVNDASTEPETLEVLKNLHRPKLRLKVLHHEQNRGLAAARNTGVAQSKAHYILPLDADDLIAPTFLKETVALLDARPEIGIAYTDFIKFGAENGHVACREYDLNALMHENFMVACSLFRRKLWKEVGGYNEEMREGYEDWALWLDFAECGWYGRRIPQPLFYYRQGSGDSLRLARLNSKRLVEIIRKRNAGLFADTELHRLWRERPDVRRKAQPAGREQPLVSVVIPCYNHGRYLGDAVRSVLEQTHPNIEIIVIDDSSTDEETKAALAQAAWPKTTVLRNDRNLGVSATRNRGFELARGEFILPLDADDILMPEMVEKCLEAMLRNKKLGWVYTDIRFFGDTNGVHKQVNYNYYLELTNNHCTVSSLIRKEAWKAAGGYNPNLESGYEDWDFWIACSKNGWHGAVVDGAYFGYRLHGVSRSTVATDRHMQLINRIRKNHPEVYVPWNVSELRKSWPTVDTDRRHLPACEVQESRESFVHSGDRQLFSIVVPVYRHWKYLDECIASVLGQTDKDFELLLVCEPSESPEIEAVLARYRQHPKVRLVINPGHNSISNKLNLGVLAASGEYVAFVDCDDRLVDNALETLRSYLLNGPVKYFVSSLIIDIDENGQELQRRTRPQVPGELLKGNFAGHLKVIKRDVFAKCGLFDPELDGCQDYDLVLRIQEAYPIHFLQTPLYCYRWHPGTVSVSKVDAQKRLETDIVQWTRFRRWLRDDGIQKSFKDTVALVVPGRPAMMQDRIESLFTWSRLPLRLVVPAEDGTWQVIKRQSGPGGVTFERTGGLRSLAQVLRAADASVFAFLPEGAVPAAGWLEWLYYYQVSRKAQVTTPLQYSAVDDRCISIGLNEHRGAFTARNAGLGVDELSNMAPQRCSGVPLSGSLFQKDYLERLDGAMALEEILALASLMHVARPEDLFLAVPQAKLALPAKGRMQAQPSTAPGSVRG